MDWQCRHDQICEEYQHKIQMLEKDKKYFKDKLELAEGEKAKFGLEKDKVVEQF